MRIRSELKGKKKFIDTELEVEDADQARIAGVLSCLEIFGIFLGDDQCVVQEIDRNLHTAFWR